MLIGTSQLIKQCGFSTVLISDKRKGQQRLVWKRNRVFPAVCFIHFAQSGMFSLLLPAVSLLRPFGAFHRCYCDLFSICKAQRQFISMNPQFHGIAHRCELHQCDFRTGNDAHIQKMLPKRAFPAYRFNLRTLPGLQIFECHCHAPLFSVL